MAFTPYSPLDVLEQGLALVALLAITPPIPAFAILCALTDYQFHRALNEKPRESSEGVPSVRPGEPTAAQRLFDEKGPNQIDLQAVKQIDPEAINQVGRDAQADRGVVVRIRVAPGQYIERLADTRN